MLPSLIARTVCFICQYHPSSSVPQCSPYCYLKDDLANTNLYYCLCVGKSTLSFCSNSTKIKTDGGSAVPNPFKYFLHNCYSSYTTDCCEQCCIVQSDAQVEIPKSNLEDESPNMGFNENSQGHHTI